jgi:selenocysteine-specific elongation factor
LDVDALAVELKVSPKPLQSMITALQHLGTIVSLPDGLLVHVKKLDVARTALLDYFENNTEISVATFRDLLNGNRRTALALLIQFDHENLTKRLGDVRVRV